ncbi:MAG: DUF4340 domain-containing protein [Steroidobacteraceae bacterium]
MMRLSSRGLAALLAAGVIVIAIALWVTSRQPSPSGGAAGELVLPQLAHSLNAISEVRLSKGDGSHTTLEKRADDWIIAERGFPADSGLVRKLLIHLSQLKVVEEKTRDPASYPVIGVEAVTSPRATGTRIDLSIPGSKLSLIVGNPSGDDASFVRVVGSKTSLLASPQIIPESDPRHWLDDTVLSLPESRVESVRVEPAKGHAYTVARGSAQQLDFSIAELPRGRELSSVSAANAVANALSSLTLDDVRKASGPPGGGLERAIFRTFDGLTVEVSGRRDGASRYIELAAKSTTKATAAQADEINARFAGWELEVLGYEYDAIFQPLDGLLKPLPPRPKGKTKPAVRRRSQR